MDIEKFKNNYETIVELTEQPEEIEFTLILGEDSNSKNNKGDNKYEELS